MKNIFLLIGILIIVLVGGLFVYSTSTAASDGFTSNDNASSEGAQKIVISMKDYNYYPRTIRVTVNQPVEITLDSSVKGCFRSFTIPDFNIRKHLATPTDKIIFTPTKTGTYRFACSMGMGYGTLIVE